MNVRWLATAVLALSSVAGPACADPPRDPMRPPRPAASSAARVEPRPVLTGIRRFGEQRSAIFDGTVVHAGDRVGPYTILAILDDGVRIRRGDSIAELKLAPPADAIKKPSTAPPRNSIGEN